MSALTDVVTRLTAANQDNTSLANQVVTYVQQHGTVTDDSAAVATLTTLAAQLEANNTAVRAALAASVVVTPAA